MSQLLKRLENQLLTCSQPLAKAETLARISGHLARIGKFNEASQYVVDLRREHAGDRSGPETVWIMMAEGLIHLYSNLSPLALDRMSRAQILGLSMQYPAAIAMSSAWKAHLEFEGSHFEAMVGSIRVGLQYAKADDHDSQVRIAMVLANAFMICGDRAISQIWFSKARNHAVKNGDQASIEALLYNRTAFGIASIRSSRCIEVALISDLAIARKEVESAINLQEITNAGALTNHIHLWSARLSILEGNFAVAISKLISARRGAPFADYNFNQHMVDLELSYCMAKAGSLEEALSIFNGVELDSLSSLDVDEQLVAASMQCELEAISKVFMRRSDGLTRFEDLKREYVSNRQMLRSSLSEWATA